MAIDTAIKRASMSNEFTLIRMPDPDNAWNMADRAIFNWLYAGLDYTPPPPPVGGGEQMVFSMRHKNNVVREFKFAWQRIISVVHKMDIRGRYAHC